MRKLLLVLVLFWTQPLYAQVSFNTITLWDYEHLFLHKFTSIIETGKGFETVIDDVSQQAGISLEEAGLLVPLISDSLVSETKKGGEIKVPGLGKFVNRPRTKTIEFLFEKDLESQLIFGADKKGNNVVLGSLGDVLEVQAQGANSELLTSILKGINAQREYSFNKSKLSVAISSAILSIVSDKIHSSASNKSGLSFIFDDTDGNEKVRATTQEIVSLMQEFPAQDMYAFSKDGESVTTFKFGKVLDESDFRVRSLYQEFGIIILKPEYYGFYENGNKAAGVISSSFP